MTKIKMRATKKKKRLNYHEARGWFEEAGGGGRRCVEKHGGKITACLTNWLHRGKSLFIFRAHASRAHAAASKARLQRFSHGFHRSSPFLFVFSRYVPRKSGGRNKATGNRPSGTLAWWWRHLVPLGAEFYGGETCTHCSCNQVVRTCGLSLPRPPLRHPLLLSS